MKISTFAVIATVAIGGGLTGCVDEYAYGPPVAFASVDYVGYYDGYYGPFYGGYWGPGSRFYYSDGANGRFHPDVGGHFRHQGAPGFHAISGHAPGPHAGHH